MNREVRPDMSDDDLAEIASKYSVLREFREKETSVYSIISARGLLDKLCGHMERERRTTIPNEELAKIASRYHITKEFREKEPSTYSVIQQRGLIGKLCGHMQREVRPEISDDDLAEIASQYDVLNDFMKNENSAYSIIHKRGLFDKLCGHMKRSCRVLTDDVLEEIALKYHTRLEFMEADSSAYSTACKRGIIDKICTHMERQNTPSGYWSKELCHEKALDYDSRSEFQNGNPKAYAAAQRNGWLDEICDHMIPKGNWFKRKIYVFTFSDGYAYVGLAQDPKDRYRAHIAGKGRSPIYPHIKKTGATFDFKILTDWIDKDIAGKVEDDYINQYAAEGWKMLNRAKGGSLGSITNLYTHERLKCEVEKYEYIDDFRKDSPRFYNYIKNHHLLDKYCSKMKFKRTPRGYWNLERAIAVIPECRSRKELQKNHPQAYNILNKARMLDKYYPNNSWKIKWTLERSMSVIPLCNSRKELQKKYVRAYQVLLKAGLLDDYFPLKWKPFSTEKKIAIITNCKTRIELHNRHRTVYDWASKNGLLDKYFPMKRKL